MPASTACQRQTWLGQSRSQEVEEGEEEEGVLSAHASRMSENSVLLTADNK